MSQFQGLGTGISGTSNQFQVGYAQGTGYTYGNIGGTAPQTGYANQAAATAQTLQLTSIQGNTTWGWQGQASNPSHLWGSNQGNVETVFNPGALQVSYSGYSGSAANANGSVPQAGYANQATVTTPNLQLTSAGGSTWGWQGQSSNPSHLWGSNQGSSDTVFAPGSLQVSQAGYAGTTVNVNGYAPQAGYAGSGANANGYVSQAGYVNQATITAQTLQIQATGSSTWSWQGQQGIPGHYWGSNDGVNMYVWQSNQGYAGYSGSAGNANGSVPQATNATYADIFNGTVTGYSTGSVGQAGSASYLQGMPAKPYAWRNYTNGNSSGVSQYQGNAYGNGSAVFSQGQAANSGWTGTIAGIQCQAAYATFQQTGPGFILWDTA